MKTTNFWICDSCHKMIKESVDGTVEWSDIPELRYQGAKCKNIRLVHRKCSSEKNDENLCDRPLSDFLGFNGLMQLLEFISDDKFIEKEEVLEFIKRLHIKGYEQARFYFNDAIADGIIEINGKERYYAQHQIDSVIKEYCNQNNKY